MLSWLAPHKQKELAEDVEVEGSLDCSDHEVVELKTLKEVKQPAGSQP